MAVRRLSAALIALAALVCVPTSAPAAFEGSGATARLMAAQSIVPRGFEDGRIFVAEKRGTIQVFEDFGDPTPELYADLRDRVFNGWDRGLLGLALDPGFTSGRPFVYVLYSYDKHPASAQVRAGATGRRTSPGPRRPSSTSHPQR